MKNSIKERTKQLILYLDVAEKTSRTIALFMGESTANVLAALAESGTGVDVDAVLSSLKAVDNTTNLDGAVRRGLLHHNAAADDVVLTDELDHGAAGAINRFARAASDGDN